MLSFSQMIYKNRPILPHLPFLLSLEKLLSISVFSLLFGQMCFGICLQTFPRHIVDHPVPSVNSSFLGLFSYISDCQLDKCRRFSEIEIEKFLSSAESSGNQIKRAGTVDSKGIPLGREGVMKQCGCGLPPE